MIEKKEEKKEKIKIDMNLLVEMYDSFLDDEYGTEVEDV